MTALAGNEHKENNHENRDLDLVKIQIFSEHAHSRMTSQITNTYALFIGFVAFFYTLYYENVVPLFGFIVGLAIFLAGTVYETYHVRQVFKGNVKKTSGMIESVKKEQELPNLEDLMK